VGSSRHKRDSSKFWIETADRGARGATEGR